jgi:hypothetical protein
MGTYRTRDFEAALVRIGFRQDMTHHQMFWYYDGERKSSLHTRTSHGEKEFDDSMLALRRRQIGNLSKPQMLELLAGTLTAEQFREHLVAQGILPESASSAD